MADVDGPTWKVGQLARLTGLTVRTLHHYDQLRLLRPSARTPSGHRLYDERDIGRLYRIVGNSPPTSIPGIDSWLPSPS